MQITFVLEDLCPDCLKCFTVSASISEIFWKPTRRNIITLRNEINVCIYLQNVGRVRRVRDRMVVGFTTTYALSVHHHYRCELEPRSWRGVFDTALCDKVCQW